MSDVSYMPDGFHSVTPSLTFRDSKAAMEFYGKAFGAVERLKLEDENTGKILHAEFVIGDSILMCSDEFPEYGALAPDKGEGGLFMIYVSNVDGVYQQSLDAGAEELMPLQDQFWGDRSGRVACPFGYRWTIAQQVRQLSDDEIEAAAEEWKAENLDT